MALPAFQTTINPFAQSLAPAIEGDWASSNPRASMLAGEGALVAGAAPVTVGRFGWASAAGLVSNSFPGAGARVGFIGIHQQVALITSYLGGFSMAVQPGYEMTLHDTADVWMRFAAGATVGQKVFANYADGSAISGAAGSTPAGGAVTASIANTGVMTVTAVGSGTILPGQPVSGGTTAAGTVVTSQLTGTPGGTGTYATAPTGQTVASAALTTAGGFETRWFVDSTAAAGELAMTSTRG
jgi:hypothetical protein